jgi:hypothetical protein
MKSGVIQDDREDPTAVGHGKARLAEHVRACGVYAIR